MYREIDLALVHEGPEVEAVCGFGGHPLGIQPHQLVDGFYERTVRQLWQGQPSGGAPESVGVGFGAEDRDSPILLPIRLEPFENRRRVVEDGRAGVHRDRSVWTD